MNILKEAQSFIGFATHCPLLYKATSDDDKPTPGYIIEEIIKISFLTSQHRLYLIEFLLDKLRTSRWPGKQKVVRILIQLSKKGHYEIRVLLRQKDSILRKVASQGGIPDPVLANTPELFLNSAIQELLVCIFDSSTSKSDAEKVHRGDLEKPLTLEISTGYGSSSNNTGGKYEGFGSTPIARQESIIDQVYDMFDSVVTSSEKNKDAYLKNLLVTDKGNYKPFLSGTISMPIPYTSISQTSNIQKSRPPLIYSSLATSRAKAHVAGKAGGGWASDDEEEEIISQVQVSLIETEPEFNTAESLAVDDFIDKFLCTHNSWPVKFDVFLNTDGQIKGLCREELLLRIVDKVNESMIVINKAQMKKFEDPVSLNLEKEIVKENYVTNKDLNFTVPTLSDNEIKIMVLLLFLEYSYYNSWISPYLIYRHCLQMLTSLQKFNRLHSSIQIKASKISSLLKVFLLPNSEKT